MSGFVPHRLREECNTYLSIDGLQKFKKTLKRDGSKRNVMGFKIIYLKSKIALGHLGHLGPLNLNKSPTRNYILGYAQKICFYAQKMCSFSYGCFSSFNLLHLFTLLN